MKIFLVIFCSFLCNAFALSQTNTDTLQKSNLLTSNDPKFSSRVGLTGSMFTGYGLTYMTKISDDFWIEGTGSIFGSGETNSSNIRMTIGIELQRDMLKSEEMRFYTFVATSYWYNNDKFESPISSNSESNYVGGLGMGFEVVVMKHLALNIESGFLYRSTSLTNTSPELTSSHYYLGIGVGGGIRYTF